MVDYKKYRSRIGDYIASVIARYSLQFLEDRNIISFAGGLPDPVTFPIEDIKKIVIEVLENYGTDALQYMPSKGVSIYIKELIDFLHRVRGIRANIDEILVTSGSQQAIDIVSRMYINENDYIVVEEPTYIAALNVLRAEKPNFVGVPIDDNGMRVDVLEEKLRKLRSENRNVKLLYTVSTAQNPSGVTLSIDRRKYLVELSEEFDFLIIEDDAYGLMVFDGEAPPPIYSLDRYKRVIYVGSLSKVLTPGLRLGHIVAPKEVIDSLEPIKQITDLHTPSLTQFIGALALREKIIEKNMDNIKQIYKTKRDVMLESIEEHFIKTAWWTRPIGGMFIWVKLNLAIDTEKLVSKAFSKGVLYVPGKGFYYNENGYDTMRLNFTFPKIEQIEIGIKRLADVVKEEAASCFIS